ncbi:family 20 glycosylhydrolase [Mucilaginibacter sp. cycad4]|uniref:beta-N-acetylhexosaminidase n=1 Tax=Mucilaginibacter sp. cycad4 TaxID=3342096 RepID=UPI002AABA4A8|nr:family 20 glycosylhydrolase [Mucilaginibacter gossypii]WPV02010.1 family 20 glycosylhydrolase [Mucilaginibacter gossypii]
MKRLLIIILACVSLKSIAQGTGEKLNVMPYPMNLRQTEGKFRIAGKFTIAVKATAGDSLLYRVVNRAYQALNRETGLVFPQQYILPNDTISQYAVKVTVLNKAKMFIGADESYKLLIEPSHIKLDANNTIGALRGLQTMIQLCMRDREGYYFPCVSISDAPRFQWRGLMIDVARHFVSADGIKRNIDAMAAVKMNVLHWHLSDDEGFRVESKLFPMLQEKGSNGDFYTQTQLKEIVAYAADRGIIIIPEFDMPGHSQSWFAGYPELASQPGPYRPGPRPQWQNEHPDPNRPHTGGMADMVVNLEASTFDATNEKVYKFLDNFLGEMTTVFPSPYVHIGADENNGLAWKLNPAIVKWMVAHNMQSTEELQRYFVNRVHKILTKHHRETIGWEELFNENIPKDVIVQKWIPATMGGIIKSHGSPADFAAHGNKSLISEGFYLDTFMPAVYHYNNPEFENVDLTGVLGGEAAQWTELADNANIDARIWPRAGAIAERLWSPASVKDVDDMYRRLSTLNLQLDLQGLLQISNYERALRRLAGTEDIAQVKTLTDVLSPVRGYQKMIAGFSKGPAAAYQTTPFTSVSDILFVDSDTKRKFRESVKAFLKNHDKKAEGEIRNYLAAWQINDSQLQQLFLGNKRLADVKDQSKNLSLAAAIGLQALDRLAENTAADKDWAGKQFNALESYSRPRAETQIAVLPEITVLVSATLGTSSEVSFGGY